MKNIKIKVGMSYIGEKGCVFAIISEDINEKSVYKIIKAKSPNESLILGIAEILKDINGNQKADIYVQTNFGFKFMQNKKKWCNREAGDALLKIANEKNIELNFIDSGSREEIDTINTLKYEARKTLLKEIRLDNVRREEGISEIKTIPKYFVEIFVKGSANTANPTKPGKYIALLNCCGKEKEIVGHGVDTTTNRMIIEGAIQAIKALKHPCNIELNTPTDVGVETKSKANFDLIHDLRTEILKGGHILIGKVSDKRQKELSLKLKKVKYKVN